MHAMFSVKRIISALSFILLLSSVSFTVSAHAGRTDASGGHVDSSTGEYHYHHGYPAHAHFDIDGDGVIDCPYRFEDATAHGSSGGSANSGASAKSDRYQSAYADGYKKGYEDGLSESQKESDKQLRATEETCQQEVARVRKRTFFLSVCGCIAVMLPIMCAVMHNREKFYEWQVNAERKKAEDRIATLSAEHASAIADLDAVHTSQINDLKLQIANIKCFTLLDKIAAGQVPSIQFPDDVYLRQSFTPIKGRPTKQRPYGDYTVYVNALGTRYHCSASCRYSGKPMHFFDLPSTAKPCSLCVPASMYPQPLPDWLLAVHKMLEDQSTDFSSDSSSERSSS